MRYSTRTRYGLRFLSYLGRVYKTHGPARITQLGEVASAEDISLKYLEQIVRKLRPLKIIDSVRGVKGGYRLAAEPCKFRIDEIFDCLEGNISPVPCTESPAVCPRIENCSAYQFWRGLDECIRSYLRSLTLADIMLLPKGIAAAEMPPMRATAEA
ncbi:MAG: Rrf2 family transcriptional regulator [Desulfovibrionaceae bacterium]|nr:Rrf2 family transcriptional regulator [Desulfovibrionaceae bacterium]